MPQAGTTTTPRRRKVRCPNCTALLSEPAAASIFQCPICLVLLVAKGARVDSQSGSLKCPPKENGNDGDSTQPTKEGESKSGSLESPPNENGNNGESTQQTKERVLNNGESTQQTKERVLNNGESTQQTKEGEYKLGHAINGSDELSRTQRQHQPTDQERKENTSINGNDRMQEQQYTVHVRKEVASLVEENREEEQQLMNDVSNESTPVSDIDRAQGQQSADNACTESLANDGMLGLQKPVDYVSKVGISDKEGISESLAIDGMLGLQKLVDYVSKVGISDNGSGKTQEEVPMDFVNEQTTLINGDDRTMERLPIVFAENEGTLSTRKEGGLIAAEDEGAEGQGHEERDSLVDGSSWSGKTQEDVPMDFVNEQASLINGDDRTMECLPIVFAANEGTSSTRKEGGLIAAEDEGEEGQGHEKRRSLVDENTDTTYDLSFKYSLEGVSDQTIDTKKYHRSKTLPAETSMPETDVSDMPLHTHLRVGLPHSCGEISDQREHESYSSEFESPSHDGSESDFDFPAVPLSEMLQSGCTNKLYPDSDYVVSIAPTQLEMQDLDQEVVCHRGSTLQKPSGHSEGPQLEIPLQIGDAGKFASDVMMGLDFRVEVAIPINELLLQEDNAIKKEPFLPTRLDEAEATISGFRHPQSDHCPSGLADVANPVGSMVPEGDSRNVDIDGSWQGLNGSNVRGLFVGREEKKTDSQGSPSHQVIEKKLGSYSWSEQVATNRYPRVKKDLHLRENSHSDPREELDTAVLQESALTEQQTLSDNSAVYKPESRMYYQRNGPPERPQLYDRHQGMHHARFIPQVQRSPNSEGGKMKGSIVDWQGHNTLLQNQSRQAGLHVAEQSPSCISHYPVNNFFGFCPARSHSYGCTNKHIVSDSSGSGVPSANRTYPYQVPSHPFVLPVAMQGHTFTHCGYHPISPVCMLCVHCQHSHVPQPQMLPCALCISQSISMAQQPQASVYGSSPIGCSQTCCSSNLELESQALSVRKHKLYPPLPQGSAVPYVMCKDCSRILQVPAGLPPNDGITQKLRCGGCGKVSKFSVYNDIPQTCIASSQAPAVESTVVASSTLPLVQSNKHSRQIPVSKITQSMESSYHQGSVIGSHKMLPQTNGIATTAFTNRTLDYNSRGVVVSSSQSRYCETDTFLDGCGEPNLKSSLSSPFENAESLCVVESQKDIVLRMGKFGSEGSKMRNGLPLQSTVDEKEEGLDFGAPRFSDGESLDQSESRMRSPENKQGYHQENYGAVSGKEPLGRHQAAWTTESRQQQVLESTQSPEHGTTQEKKAGSPLITLFNQESTRFKISLQERVSFEDSRSPLRSHASGSPLYDDHPAYERPYEREQNTSGSHGPSAQHSVRKGPRYITGLLRRSLKDFGRGGQ